jgi:hypothetical protein
MREIDGRAMESSLRHEVQEFVRASNDLAGSAHENNGALTNEECEMVMTCIHTLQKNVLPHQADDAQPLAAPLAIPPVID